MEEGTVLCENIRNCHLFVITLMVIPPLTVPGMVVARTVQYTVMPHTPTGGLVVPPAPTGG